MSEIAGLQEGVEGLRVMIEGSDKFLRLGGDLSKYILSHLLRFAKFLFNVHKAHSAELKEGEVPFKELFKKSNNEVGLMRIDSDKLQDFVNHAKASGISYSIMPDINKADGKTEIAFPQSQAFAVNYFCASNKEFSEVITFDDYFKNANQDDLISEMQKMEDDILSAKSAKDMGLEGNEVVDSVEPDGVVDGLGNDDVIVDTFNSEKNYSDIMSGGDYNLVKVKSEYMDEALFAEKGNSLIAIPNTRDQYVVVSNNRFTGDLAREKSKSPDEKGKVLSVDCVFGKNEELAIVDKDGRQLLDEKMQPVTISSNDLSQRFLNIDKKNKEIADRKEKTGGMLYDGKGNVKYLDKDKAARINGKSGNVVSVEFGKNKTTTPNIALPKTDTPKLPKPKTR